MQWQAFQTSEDTLRSTEPDVMPDPVQWSFRSLLRAEHLKKRGDTELKEGNLRDAWIRWVGAAMCKQHAWPGCFCIDRSGDQHGLI